MKAIGLAEKLVEHYQPKLPDKDSVVLTGLELADYKHYKEYTKSLAQASKETAEKIYLQAKAIVDATKHNRNFKIDDENS